jgi:hypothetical protein
VPVPVRGEDRDAGVRADLARHADPAAEDAAEPAGNVRDGRLDRADDAVDHVRLAVLVFVQRHLAVADRFERDVVDGGGHVRLRDVDPDDPAAIRVDRQPFVRPPDGPALQGRDPQHTFGEELGDQRGHRRGTEPGVPGDLLPGRRTQLEQRMENLEPALVAKIT